MPRCVDCGDKDLPESAFYRATGKRLGKRCKVHERARKDRVAAEKVDRQNRQEHGRPA